MHRRDRAEFADGTKKIVSAANLGLICCMKTDPLAPPLQIAKPCPKDWDGMEGDSKRRFCGHCQLHVHNLSAMGEKERARLIAETGGRLCIAYELRPDGSMVTPGKGSWARRGAQPVRRAVAALLATVMPGLLAACSHNRRAIMGEVAPPPGPSTESTMEKGKPVMMLGAPLAPAPSSKIKEMDAPRR